MRISIKTILKKIIFFSIILLLLSSCSIVDKNIKRSQNVELKGRRTFRINYIIHDDKGEDITDEIMKSELDRWLLFVEACDRAKVAFEELGYELVYDPGKPADFIVDIGFSAFYSDKITEDQMLSQPPATFLIGKKDDEFFYHYAVLTILARDPSLSSDEYVVIWEGKGICKMVTDDIREAEFTIMTELLEDYPNADLNRE